MCDLVHLQPDGEKLVLTKRSAKHLQSLTMMNLRHKKIAEVRESPSSWHSSSSFAKVREIPQIGTPLFSKLYRTDEQTCPLIDLLAAGKKPRVDLHTAGKNVVFELRQETWPRRGRMCEQLRKSIIE